MSYILDALKKSETERTRGVSPSLLGATQGMPLFTTRVIVLVAIALFVNAALLTAWWLWPRPLTQSVAESAPVSAPPQATTVSPQARTALPQPTTTAPAAAVPANARAQPPEATVSVPQEIPAAGSRQLPEIEAPTSSLMPAAETPRTQTISFGDLTAQEQQAFDGLDFSTHVFADDPEFRAVTLNGKRFKEGEPLTSELMLDQITEDGVVVGYRGKRVELPVLQDWRI